MHITISNIYIYKFLLVNAMHVFENRMVGRLPFHSLGYHC